MTTINLPLTFKNPFYTGNVPSYKRSYQSKIPKGVRNVEAKELGQVLKRMREASNAGITMDWYKNIIEEKKKRIKNNRPLDLFILKLLHKGIYSKRKLKK